MATIQEEESSCNALSFTMAEISKLPTTLGEMVEDPRYNQGRDFVNGGDFDHAIELFENLLETT